MEDLGNCVGNRHNLVEGLALAYHAEIGTRTLFGRILALLKVDNFGVQSGVVLAQGIVETDLLRNSCTQSQCFSVAVIRKPEFGLKTEPGNTE